MNFIEAVRELKEGRCTHIKHKRFGNIHGIYEGRETCFCLVWSDGGKLFNNATLMLSEDWELVNPKPQFEEVEIVKWYCNICGKICLSDDIHCGKPIVKLTGIFKNEIKPKVKHRIKLTHAKHFIALGSAVPLQADIFAEWEE